MTSITGGGDFRVGDVLSRAWRIFSANLPFFLGVPFLIYAVIFIAAFIGAAVFGILFAVAGLTSHAGLAVAAGIVFVIITIAATVVGQGVLLFGAFQRLRGHQPRIGEALQKVFARFVPLAGLGILWAGALVAVTAVSVAVSTGLVAAIGFLAFVLSPALVMWAMVVPACLVEGLGPIASIQRSAALSKGYRWKVFGILALLGLLILAGDVAQLILARVSQAPATVVGLVWFLVWTAYWNCSIIMMYHDLRVAKEGVDTEQIASIFD